MLTFFLILFLIVIIAFLVFQVNQLIVTFRYVPYVPISSQVLEQVTKELDTGKKQVIYDLGCGDARVLRKFADAFPENTYKGIELGYWPYLLARFLSRKDKNITIMHGNFFKMDLSDADIVYCYLFPKVMESLEEYLPKQLKPGSTIISCAFPFTHMKPDKVLSEAKTLGSPVYIYTVK